VLTPNGSRHRLDGAAFSGHSCFFSISPSTGCRTGGSLLQMAELDFGTVMCRSRAGWR
jgi:hypothetical protein